MSSDRIPLTRRYLSSVIRYRREFFGMLLCMVAAGGLQVFLPWMLAPLLDAAAGEKKYIISPSILPYTMLLTVFLIGAFSYGRVYLGEWLNATLQRDYRARMARQLLHLPLSRFQQDTSGALTSRFMLFLPQLTGATMPVCMALVQESIKTIGYVAMMFYLQWQLALIVLIVAPICVGTIRLLGRRMKIAAGKVQQTSVAVQSRLNEMITTAPVVKMAGEQSALNRLNRTFNALRGSNIRTSVILAVGQPLTHIIISLPFAVIVGYIISALAQGAISAGEAASFLVYMLLLPTPVRVITRSMSVWEQMLVAAREVYGFIDSASEPDNGSIELTRTAGAIDFQQITFQYDNSAAAVLDDFSLAVNAGETIALVGRSGAGKTTLCNLLPRFYLPQQGAVLLDGEDINRYTLASLRRQIAVVPQKPLLFDDSIAMNVAFPDAADADRDKIITALQNAAADDFVNALPQGIETRIGENGDLLSGGQKQRLMLARALYRNAPVIILDEPTSALDSETESKIKIAMRRLLAGRTAIIIAHRFATINFADRIAVIDHGKLLAVGTSDELRRTCPLFADLYNAQRLED